MPNPVVSSWMLGELMLVDSNGLPEAMRLNVEAMATEGLNEIPTAMRCTEEECQGDIPSILLGAFKGLNNLVGVVSIASLSIMNQVDNLLEVKANVMPYFPGVANEMAAVEDLFSRFFNQPVELANGTQLAILDLMEFRRLKVLDPGKPKEARVIDLSQRAEAAGFSEVVPDPADPAREIVRVRRTQP